jgi:hypothetical protein
MKQQQKLICQLEAIARQITQIQQAQASIVLPDQPPIEIRGISKETSSGDRPTPDEEVQLQLHL